MEKPFFTDEQINLAKRTFLSEFSDNDKATFIALCERTQLDPFAKEIYATRRFVKNPSTGVREPVLVPVTGIGGFRKIAHRSNEHAATGLVYFSPDAEAVEAGIWFEAWTRKEFPFAAKVNVWKRGETIPTTAVVTWDSYAQRDEKGYVVGFWAAKPDVMLGKVAEAVVLRKAFSPFCEGLYLAEEVGFAGMEAVQAGAEVAPVTEKNPRDPKVEPSTEAATAVREQSLRDLKTLIGGSRERMNAARSIFQRRKNLMPGQELDDLHEDVIMSALRRRKEFLKALERECRLLAVRQSAA
jgi:phage recombination protein Bet